MDVGKIVVGAGVAGLGGLLRAPTQQRQREARKPKDGLAKHGLPS
jgi:hypothetical protein